MLLGNLLYSPISAFAQVPAFSNTATYTYTDPASNQTFESSSITTSVISEELIDPLGQILGCNGQLLPDYQGFTVALYDPDPNDPTGTQLGNLTSLTTTEVPDIPDNGVSQGIAPNTTNINPFPLTNANEGFYNFLFDTNKGQADVGRTYILVVTPPADSTIYTQRRIKLEITSNSNNILQYTATSLDGVPISLQGDTQLTQEVSVSDAERIGLSLLPMNLDMGLCQNDQLRIIKTGDRATAEPGDTVIYRLSLRNQGDAGLDNVVVTDTLPTGFKLLPKSVMGEIDGQSISIITENNKSQVIFKTNETIPTGGIINIVYATQLTPDAVRGSGRNSAIVNAQRTDNDFAIKDGPATHLLRIRPGLVSDCGTIIGRVFVDKNFDGEQQSGEPGVPNAVIFLENGNRVTTDANGLFSVAKVLPGAHTGVLDLSSLPGYTLAPNRKFKERNSQSRLVRLAPGGMVRMNFAVTPTFKEEAKK
ncbi:MAG: hypothetical protein QNJ47_14215 [Nostocaceae cyanobacterium]|nr:hypothetical protein [Nostocaceae cyanobacterium]